MQLSVKNMSQYNWYSVYDSNLILFDVFLGYAHYLSMHMYYKKMQFLLLSLVQWISGLDSFYFDPISTEICSDYVFTTFTLNKVIRY